MPPFLPNDQTIMLKIPPQLEAATLCGTGNCDLSRRAACEVIAPYSSDPWYRNAITNTAAHALRSPSCDQDHELMNMYRQRFLNMLASANPLEFGLEEG